MAWVRLANWLDGAAPGDVVEVPDERVKSLTRDGRIAEVLPSRRDGGEGPDVERYAEAGGVLPPGLTKARNDTGQPEAVEPARRGRRKAQE